MVIGGARLVPQDAEDFKMDSAWHRAESRYEVIAP